MVGAAALPALAGGDDAELLALEAEINRLVSICDEILESRVYPHDEAYEIALGGGALYPEGRVTAESWREAWRISDETGRSAALDEHEVLAEQWGQLFTRMRKMAALTDAGRKAKVRAALLCAMGDKWRGPATGLDYHRQVARELLGEFAGMTEEELANV
jgi:hypothetical protein